MPELAEVEFYRKQWDGGLNQKILTVHLHDKKRILRGVDTKLLEETLTGSTLLESKTHGKQMLFRFSKGGWLGVHLGMTGKLFAAPRDYEPAKHDHFVLTQKGGSLVFSDPRQFGRILFCLGKDEPDWWKRLPAGLLTKDFTRERMETFLKRRARAPIKAVLLMQEGFPGIGNWMADEILWRAKINPRTGAGEIGPTKTKLLFGAIRFVCQEALETIGKDFSDPPPSWLFRHRWKKGGDCPRCKSGLKHATIGGRTTCWCPRCQP